MLALAWLVYMYFGAMAVSFAPILLTIERDLRISDAGGGMLLGAYPLAYVVSALAVGKVCDYLGVRTSTALGIVVLAGSLALRAASPNFGLLLFAATLFGVGGPVVSTVLPKLVAERFEGTTRTFASAIYVSGPPVGAAIILSLTSSVFMPLVGNSWHRLFLSYALAGIIVLGLWLLFARDVGIPVRQARKAHRAQVSAVVEAGVRAELMVEAVVDAGVAGASAATPLWRLGPLWMIVLVGIVCFAVSQGFASWLPSILESKGFSPARAGLWASICRLLQVPGSIIICYILGQVQLRNGRKRTVCVLLAITASSIALIAPDLRSGVYAVLLVQGAAVGAIMPLLLSLIMDLSAVPASQMAVAAALYFTVGQIAGAGAPVVVGWLRDTTGGFAAGLALVAGITLAAVLPASRISDEQSAEVDVPAVMSDRQGH